jgi:uncharacterized glyoxalase superfamily protein PhnB
MFPMIVVRDPAPAAEWYRTRFGFDAVASLGWYEHLRDAGGRELGFLAAGAAGQPAELRTAASGQGFALSFEVDDLEASWSAWGCKEQVLMEPTQEEWGQYHFMVYDAAGTVVDVIQADPPSEGGGR